MSKMQKAFEKWLLDEQGLPCTWNKQRNCYDEFPAHLAWKSYQAAIAAVKEGGPVAWIDGNRRLTLYRNLITPRFFETAQPLYKIELEE